MAGIIHSFFNLLYSFGSIRLRALWRTNEPSKKTEPTDQLSHQIDEDWPKAPNKLDNSYEIMSG